MTIIRPAGPPRFTPSRFGHRSQNTHFVGSSSLHASGGDPKNLVASSGEGTDRSSLRAVPSPPTVTSAPEG
jgi:hypothetical protein